MNDFGSGSLRLRHLKIFLPSNALHDSPSVGLARKSQHGEGRSSEEEDSPLCPAPPFPTDNVVPDEWSKEGPHEWNRVVCGQRRSSLGWRRGVRNGCARNADARCAEQAREEPAHREGRDALRESRAQDEKGE